MTTFEVKLKDGNTLYLTHEEIENFLAEHRELIQVQHKPMGKRRTSRQPSRNATWGLPL